MMTGEQFNALVRQVEEYAHTNRRGYRRRVGALALLGYAYVWVALLVCLGVLALLAWLFVSVRSGAWAIGKIAIPLVVLVGAVIRALWVTFPPPAGVRLTRRDVPAVFALLNDLTHALHTPRFHRVLLTDDFNAAVSQHPRLGLFGWYRNYLLLGLPLMLALSADEFKAVLAHELGHLSREHGRFGAWIYRVRMAWMRIVAQLEAAQHWGYQLFDWFLKRWAPYFNAYSFVLAREQEYEADRFAAGIAGAEHLARALEAMEVQGARLEREFWPGLFRTAVRHAEPPQGVLTSLGQTLRAPPPENSRRWLAAALNRRTGTDDTHPSLADRLRALRVTPAEPRALAPPSAAERLFGAGLSELTGKVEALWREAVAQGWRVKHETDIRGQVRLEKLDAEAAMGTLDREAAGERAELTLVLRGRDAGIEPLRDLLARDPDNALGNFALGEILLDRGEEAGIAHLERAVTGDPALRAQAYQRIWTFYEEQGRIDEAAKYRRRVWEHGDAIAQAEVERRNVTPRDTLLPHELSTERLTPIREALARVDGLSEAYLVRKAVTHLPEEPFYILGVKRRVAWYRFQSEAAEQQFVEQVARDTPLPGAWLVVALNRHTAKIRKKMRRVVGAQLIGSDLRAPA